MIEKDLFRFFDDDMAGVLVNFSCWKYRCMIVYLLFKDWVAWRQTKNCDRNGERDENADARRHDGINSDRSGYCERVFENCDNLCARGFY